MVLPYWLDRPPDEAQAIAAEAERLGLPEVWIGELYHFDAFALAGFLASSTTRITLTVGPVAVGVRDPVSLSRGLASVSVLGRRPARLALGASNPVVVSRFHGRAYQRQPPLMREVVAAVRRAVEEGRPPSGYRSALGTHPAHISVAAAGPRMMAVAAEVADRVVINLVTTGQAGRLAAAAGDKPVAVWLVCAVDPGEATRRQVGGQLAHYLAAPGYGEGFAEAGFASLVDDARAGVPTRDLAARLPTELIQSVCAYGSLGDVTDRIEAYRAAGVHPVIVPATAEDPAARRTLAALAASW